MIFPSSFPLTAAGVTRLFAWFLLVIVIVVTLLPADLRPSTGLPLKVERFLGFAVLAAGFTTAYPRRWLIVIALLAGVAVGLEALQLIIPTRDASPIDATVKVLGAIGGATSVHVLIAICAAQRQRTTRRLVGPSSGSPTTRAWWKDLIR